MDPRRSSPSWTLSDCSIAPSFGCLITGMTRKPRKSYLRCLQDDLELAEEAKLHPSIIADIQVRIERHKAYKHEWYKARYVPKALREVA